MVLTSLCYSGLYLVLVVQSALHMYAYRARYPDMTSDLKEFEAHLLQGARELPELKLWQLQGEARSVHDWAGVGGSCPS